MHQEDKILGFYFTFLGSKLGFNKFPSLLCKMFSKIHVQFHELGIFWKALFFLISNLFSYLSYDLTFLSKSSFFSIVNYGYVLNLFLLGFDLNSSLY